MRHTFIIDENVIAQTRNRRLAAITVQFFKLLTQNCHKVAVSPVLHSKLLNWVKRRDREFSQFFPTGPTLVRSLFTNSSKVEWFDPPEAPERQYVRDPDDWYIVDLAVASGGHYVSTGDRQTREDFNKEEFRRLGVNGLTVDQAIELAKERCLSS